MANDPAFLFYPGDYLRDTQCLSEKTQVAYDRIMCEHMRNICITQKQLNFFTKRLSEDEKEELEMILTKNSKGYQIEWVAESIVKRRAYSESRRINRTGTKKKICKTYDTHMDNEIEDVNEDKDKSKNKILFINSEYFDLNKFIIEIERNEKYILFDCEYYHECLINWSAEGKMKKDWISTARTWMLRDVKDGKPKLKKEYQHKFKQDGKQSFDDKIREYLNRERNY